MEQSSSAKMEAEAFPSFPKTLISPKIVPSFSIFATVILPFLYFDDNDDDDDDD